MISFRQSVIFKWHTQHMRYVNFTLAANAVTVAAIVAKRVQYKIKGVGKRL